MTWLEFEDKVIGELCCYCHKIIKPDDIDTTVMAKEYLVHRGKIISIVSIHHKDCKIKAMDKIIAY